MINLENVRKVNVDNEDWHVLKDVCEQLEIRNHLGVKGKLDSKVIKVVKVPNPSGKGAVRTTVVNLLGVGFLEGYRQTSEGSFYNDAEVINTSPTAITTNRYGEVLWDVFRVEGREGFFMSSEQLATVLGYKDSSALRKLVRSNSYLRDSEFSFLAYSTRTPVSLADPPPSGPASSSERGERNIIMANSINHLQPVDTNESLSVLTRFFTEDGVYEVSMMSRTPGGRAFRAVARKVFKNLRAALTPDLSQVTEQLSFLQNQVQQLQHTVEQLQKPALPYVNPGINSDLCTIKQITAELRLEGFDTGPRRFVSWLKTRDFLTRAGFPSQESLDSRMFELSSVPGEFGVTSKGKEHLMMCYRGEFYEDLFRQREESYC